MINSSSYTKEYGDNTNKGDMYSRRVMLDLVLLFLVMIW